MRLETADNASPIPPRSDRRVRWRFGARNCVGLLDLRFQDVDSVPGCPLFLWRRVQRYEPILTCAVFASVMSFEEVVVDNLDKALELARSQGTEVFIGGGGTIYAQTIDKASCMYLSIIPGEFTGDTCFPEIHKSDWEIVRREDRGTFEFIEYRRRSC